MYFMSHTMDEDGLDMQANEAADMLSWVTSVQHICLSVKEELPHNDR